MLSVECGLGRGRGSGGSQTVIASKSGTTKRLVIGQVSVCIGCCCGQTERGKPEVPVEWLKAEWRRRGLLKNIQLTISGRLGPCDVPNVVLIATAEETCGSAVSTALNTTANLWNGRRKAVEGMLPLSKDLLRHRLDPFRQVLGIP